MSGQASLIAQKKAEIESKRKAQQEAAQNSGSVSLYNQLGSSSSGGSSASLKVSQKTPPVAANFKNRWGFKGKSSQGTKR